MDMIKPVVSVYCMAYNHKNYIRDCLDGFIMQETDFPFEVIVHDDASTDGTQDIIREYEQKYPQIIKPIYQVENQYKLGIPKVPRFIFPKVTGDYVAICEGDDYWTDPKKLQKQVGLMEEHPECHFCVCGVEEVNLNKTSIGYFHPNFQIAENIIESRDFIKYASQYAFQTSSYLMRYEDWAEYIKNPPKFKRYSDMGDISMLLYFGSLGKTAYVNEVMSCYRRGAPDSFSTYRNRWSEDTRIKHFESQLKVWSLFDEFSQYQYHDICTKKRSDMMFGYCILRNNAKELLKKENRDVFNEYSVCKKTYVIAACICKKTMKKNYIKTMKNREEKKQQLWEEKKTPEEV